MLFKSYLNHKTKLNDLKIILIKMIYNFSKFFVFFFQNVSKKKVKFSFYSKNTGYQRQKITSKQKQKNLLLRLQL
ncbi:MAG: hypothetical protein BAJALOKI1v1_1940005 [Promethearchaeota archaeon]|nr:MAG: hypothetical protein BAJALOKI1v1_1940005 [Candidatus Lokiarchaeota archaeon]